MAYCLGCRGKTSLDMQSLMNLCDISEEMAVPDTAHPAVTAPATFPLAFPLPTCVGNSQHTRELLSAAAFRQSQRQLKDAHPTQLPHPSGRG